MSEKVRRWNWKKNEEEREEEKRRRREICRKGKGLTRVDGVLLNLFAGSLHAGC